MDATFKALADPTRRRLLDRLHRTPALTLNELCAHLRISRQAVTKHLSILLGAHLVVTRWRGREKLHYLNPAPLHAVYDRWIRKFDRDRLQALADLKTALERTHARKEPRHG